jgi:hypothetical protein
MVTPLALAGPEFDTTIEYVTVFPRITDDGPVLTIERSAVEGC